MIAFNYPVGKIAEKAGVGSVVLTTWHCILSAELTKNALLQTDCGDLAHWDQSTYTKQFFAVTFCKVSVERYVMFIVDSLTSLGPLTGLSVLWGKARRAHRQTYIIEFAYRRAN